MGVGVLVRAMSTLLLLRLVPPPAAAQFHGGDKAALLELKASLGNPSILSSWREDADCCDTWGSMECDNAARVTAVDIRSSVDVAGTIPPSIGCLAHLRRLVLRRCPNLVGGIPSEIGNLSRLRELRLEGNNLTGGIPPGIGRLRNLNYLSLSGNRLAGELPRSIGGLVGLDVLFLDSNEFTGAVPSSFRELDLALADLSSNRFAGDASPLFGWWKRARMIDLSANAFSFDLSRLWLPERLVVFNMSGNGVYGCIPDTADHLTRLKLFDVSHNRLSGRIPQGGVINGFGASAFEGNDGLCGHPLPPCGTGRRWVHLGSASDQAGKPRGGAESHLIELFQTFFKL